MFARCNDTTPCAEQECSDIQTMYVIPTHDHRKLSVGTDDHPRTNNQGQEVNSCQGSSLLSKRQNVGPEPLFAGHRSITRPIESLITHTPREALHASQGTAKCSTHHEVEVVPTAACVLAQPALLIGLSDGALDRKALVHILSTVGVAHTEGKLLRGLWISHRTRALAMSHGCTKTSATLTHCFCTVRCQSCGTGLGLIL